jgi:hypothetical protein
MNISSMFLECAKARECTIANGTGSASCMLENVVPASVFLIKGPLAFAAVEHAVLMNWSWSRGSVYIQK